jgi:hypothetical protein
LFHDNTAKNRKIFIEFKPLRLISRKQIKIANLLLPRRNYFVTFDIYALYLNLSPLRCPNYQIIIAYKRTANLTFLMSRVKRGQ